MFFEKCGFVFCINKEETASKKKFYKNSRPLQEILSIGY